MKDPEKSYSFLQKLKNIYEKTVNLYNIYQEKTTFPTQYRIFSDNIILFKKIDNDYFFSLAEIILDSCMFQAFTLQSGLLVRGAITHGNFYQDSIFIYGEALVKAYQLESKKAIYPRIIVDSQSLNQHTPEDFIKQDFICDYLCLDDDGEIFLDYFSPVFPPEKQTYLYPTREKIINIFNTPLHAGVKEKTKIYSKYLWLLKKFNFFCEKHNVPQNKIPLNFIKNHPLLYSILATLSPDNPSLKLSK